MAGLVCLLFASIAQAGPTFDYETTLAGEPALVRPVSVAFSPEDGTICVTDQGAQCIDVFGSDGSRRFRTDRLSGVSSPSDASIDDHGGFVFTDVSTVGERTIKRLNFLGEPVPFTPERPNDSWQPVHLAIAANGDYLTVDRKGLLVRHDSGTGALIWTVELSDPTYDRSDLMGRPAESPDGTIYVPSAGSFGVLVVSAEGKRLTDFGERGGKRGEVSFPVGVSIGPDGTVFVLDRMRHRVLVFDSEHEFVAEFGRIGDAPGDLYHPMAIASDPEGHVWIAQGFQGRVQAFRYRDDGSGAGMSRLLGPAETRDGMSVGS